MSSFSGSDFDFSPPRRNVKISYSNRISRKTSYSSKNLSQEDKRKEYKRRKLFLKPFQNPNNDDDDVFNFAKSEQRVKPAGFQGKRKRESSKSKDVSHKKKRRKIVAKKEVKMAKPEVVKKKKAPKKKKKKRKKLFQEDLFIDSSASSSSDDDFSNGECVYSPYEAFKKEDIFIVSKTHPEKRQVFKNSQEIEDLGGDQRRFDSIEYELSGIGDSNFDVKIASLNNFVLRMKEETDFKIFIRSHGLLQMILDVLTKTIAECSGVPTKKDKGNQREISLISCIQIMCYVLNDPFNCKFIADDSFRTLITSVKMHPFLEKEKPLAMNPGERSVRHRLSRITSSKEKEKVQLRKEQTVTMVLNTLMTIVMNVPYSHKIIAKIDTKDTLEPLVCGQVLLVENSKELSSEEAQLLIKDLTRSLNLLKLTSFDFSNELTTVLPALIRVLDKFASNKRNATFIFQLPESHPTVECIFTVLNMLTNLTNKNRKASSAFSYESGIVSCIKILGSNLGVSKTKYQTPGVHFDITVNVLGLLINLTEENPSNRTFLSKAKIIFPNDSVIPFFNWVADVYRLNKTKVEVLPSIMENKVKFVETNILSAYSCLLIGCCVKENKRNRKRLLGLIREKDFSGLVDVLEEFVAFKSKANLLTKDVFDGVNAIIEVLKKTD